MPIITAVSSRCWAIDHAARVAAALERHEVDAALRDGSKPAAHGRRRRFLRRV